jgi:prepilin-type N-terminal cleavage/methylation domain-containing protein
MRTEQKNGFQRGFTLLETLIVLGMFVTLLLIMLPAFYRLLQAYRLQTTASTVSTNLRFARSAALKQKIPYRLTFRDRLDINPNTYTVEYNPFGSFQTFNNLDTKIPDQITIDPTSLDEVTFDSRGAASTSGLILLTGTDGSSYKITISTTGAVDVTR